MIHAAEGASEHLEISALLPWYVNSTLAEHACRRVEAHLKVCPVCREDLAMEKDIFQKIDSEPVIDYMPAISLKRLHSRLDALETRAPAPVPPSLDHRRHVPWRGLAAASMLIMALAGGLLATDRWLQYRARAGTPAYHTVTSPASRPRDEVIRVVFSPTITLVEMQAILGEAHMRIVSGPTEAGVYSLAAESSVPVRSSLEVLRRHPAVRFAEATRPDSERDHSP
jgi:hypothetical protein